MPRRAALLAGVFLIAVVGFVLAASHLGQAPPVGPQRARPRPTPSRGGLPGGGGESSATPCRTRDGSRVRLQGAQDSPLDRRSVPAHTVVDARAARWSGRTDFPVRLGGGSGICLTGGEIRGTFSPNATWRHMHGTAGLVISSPDATVTGVRIDNYGDGVRFVRNAKDFTVNAAHFSHIRDDCVENDWLRSGIVNDTLLDGCYSAFSSRPYEGQHGRPDGRDNVVTVTNTLVRLQPMNRVYRNRGRVPGHDGFFKWHRRSPRLSLQHNVFRADQPANNVGLAVPLDKVVSCSGNVMVWLGAGEYPGSLPRCFRITRDRSVWDHAVNDWKRRHGHLS